MRQISVKRAAAAFGILVAGAGPAMATEGGASLYVPGFHGAMAGFLPPPGFYFETDLYSYSGRLSAGVRTSIGGAVLANVKAEARAAFLTPTWVTPLEILGGNLAIGVSLPLGCRVSAQAR